MTEPKASDGHKPSLWERITTLVLGVALLATGVFLVVRNKQFADPNLVVITRIIISLGVAICGASVPGFLNIEWNFRNNAIKAGGALGLFVLTYVVTPKVLSNYYVTNVNNTNNTNVLNVTNGTNVTITNITNPPPPPPILITTSTPPAKLADAGPAPANALPDTGLTGTVSSPFLNTNGCFYQPVATALTDGGQAVFPFSITNTGKYVIQALVNAPDATASSFFVNIDSPPEDPKMIWDINPPTVGFEERIATWRGNGTPGADQFVPAIFNLEPGPHQIFVCGRSAGAQLKSIQILRLPPPPPDLQILSSQNN